MALLCQLPTLMPARSGSSTLLAEPTAALPWGGLYCGVVFRVDGSGNETVIHKFFGYGGGAVPSGLLDVGGVLYGTTGGGGDSSCFPPGKGCGVVYQLGKTGQYTVLHRFAGSGTGDGDGGAVDALTLGEDGSIYGATSYGGTGKCTGGHPGCGVIFKRTRPAN
jgi:uncharacterized repeat protein (TIGR03803 family)